MFEFLTDRMLWVSLAPLAIWLVGLVGLQLYINWKLKEVHTGLKELSDYIKNNTN